MSNDPVLIWYNLQINQLEEEIIKCKLHPSNTYSRMKITKLRIEIKNLEIEKKQYRLCKLPF